MRQSLSSNWLPCAVPGRAQAGCFLDAYAKKAAAEPLRGVVRAFCRVPCLTVANLNLRHPRKTQAGRSLLVAPGQLPPCCTTSKMRVSPHSLAMCPARCCVCLRSAGCCSACHRSPGYRRLLVQPAMLPARLLRMPSVSWLLFCMPLLSWLPTLADAPCNASWAMIMYAFGQLAAALHATARLATNAC